MLRPSATGCVSCGVRAAIHTCTANAGCMDGNPNLDCVLADDAARKRYMTDHPTAPPMLTWPEAENEIAAFFSQYVTELHPCKDAFGNAFFNIDAARHRDPFRPRPQTVHLRVELEREFELSPTDDVSAATPEPDLSRLRALLLASIETGQRHTLHRMQAPCLSLHACARNAKPPRACPTLPAVIACLENFERFPVLPWAKSWLRLLGQIFKI